ncbi:MAG: GTP 3',8-cyclase MoaA [Cyanobacteria bacterium LVE1205-1]
MVNFHMDQLFIDTYHRRIHKLRVSLTDHCNLRCQYCMPVNAEFMDHGSYLQPADYATLIGELQRHGINEVRLTGGEPLLRHNFQEIVHHLRSLNLPKISVTTNGLLLHHHLDFLARSGILDINISLDSLHSHTFQRITHRLGLKHIQHNIALAKAQQFRIKVNMVVMKGVNDHEIYEFIEYAKMQQVEVRFLEVMRIGYACQQQSHWFIPAHELIEKIKQRYELIPVPSPLDATAFSFQTSCGARIGFIASESQPFCGHCSRWRLSADGILRACLLKEEGVSLKNTTPEQRQHLYQTLLGMKPYLRPPEVHHAMYTIGG